MPPPAVLEPLRLRCEALLAEHENARHTAIRVFYEAVVEQAKAAGRPQPSPAHIAMLAAHARLDPLGTTGMQPARRRWEERIRRWSRESTPPPAIAALRGSSDHPGTQ